LEEIVDTFAATYVGDGKICESVHATDIAFHATRALQELSYDTLRSTKDWEVVIPATLVLVMPHDFVNYIRVSWTDDGGIERIVYPTSKTSNPADEANAIDTWGGFNATSSTDESSYTRDKFESRAVDPAADSNQDIDAYDSLLGTRFGLSPEHAQSNGSFYIDESAGKFHFSSNMSGKTLVLRYISDGIVTDSGAIDLSSCLVPKLAEEAIYKWILYGVLLAKKDTPAGLLGQVKKERFAETRKAKIRLSNLKTEEITQILRGSSKIIKH
tara:strand:- start:111 stop:923 length:813 start_codon:yes stop_codon:yes gene_type:complete